MRNDLQLLLALHSCQRQIIMLKSIQSLSTNLFQARYSSNMKLSFFSCRPKTEQAPDQTCVFFVFFFLSVIELTVLLTTSYSDTESVKYVQNDMQLDAPSVQQSKHTHTNVSINHETHTTWHKFTTTHKTSSEVQTCLFTNKLVMKYRLTEQNN